MKERRKLQNKGLHIQERKGNEIMMKPNDFCVNDVKFRCVWGSRTTWDALNEIQKERKDKIVFSGTVEERGEGSRYALFRDDEQGTNYLISIGKQEPGKELHKNKYDR